MTSHEARPTRASAPLASVDLLFDEASELAIRQDWIVLEGAGLSSLGAHKASSNRPHITLLAAPAPLLFGGPIATSFPIRVRIGAPVLFGSGDRRVLARVVTPTVELLELHSASYAAVGINESAPSADPHTRPGAWQPHVTLARRIRLETLAEALHLLGDEIEGEVTAMQLWDPTTGTVTPLSGR